MGRAAEDEYVPLVSDEPPFNDDDDLVPEVRRRTVLESSSQRRLTRVLYSVIVLQALVLFILGFAYVNLRRGTSSMGTIRNEKALLYSPAQNIVEHEIKTFTAGRANKTIYQGSNDDVDQAWLALYNNTIMKIPKSQAAMLPNKTYPISVEREFYMAELDVFHQLHCLNIVRRALDKKHYPDDPYLENGHVSHCVDSVRQSLMCSSDISVNVWQWRPSSESVVGYSTVAHTCRNFEKLREWAVERQLDDWIDTKLHIEDDLPAMPVLYS